MLVAHVRLHVGAQLHAENAAVQGFFAQHLQDQGRPRELPRHVELPGQRPVPHVLDPALLHQVLKAVGRHQHRLAFRGQDRREVEVVGVPGAVPESGEVAQVGPPGEKQAVQPAPLQGFLHARVSRDVLPPWEIRMRQSFHRLPIRLFIRYLRKLHLTNTLERPQAISNHTCATFSADSPQEVDDGLQESFHPDT